MTVTVAEDEWIQVANWLYEHWNIIGGLSFLPKSNHVYQLAPYDEVDKATFEKLQEKMQHVDFSQLVSYERSDETEMRRELACAGGGCEAN